MKKKIPLKEAMWLLARGVLLFAIIAMLFIGCPTNGNENEEKPNPKKCECTADQKASHYLPCDCVVEAPNVCNDACCPQIARGYVKDADRPSINVPIYQTVGVSDTDATVATTNIQNGYTGLTNTRKNTLAGANNFNKIEIVAGTEDSFDAINGVVKIALDSEFTVGQVFLVYVLPNLTNEATMAKVRTNIVPKYTKARQQYYNITAKRIASKAYQLSACHYLLISDTVFTI